MSQHLPIQKGHAPRSRQARIRAGRRQPAAVTAVVAMVVAAAGVCFVLLVPALWSAAIKSTQPLVPRCGLSIDDAGDRECDVTVALPKGLSMSPSVPGSSGAPADR